MGDARIIDRLPMLRRYARGFMGSALAGDQLIEECLRGYFEGQLDGDLTQPVHGLFRLFHDYLAGAALRVSAIRGLPARPNDLHATLLALPHDERAAVLLTRTMGFSYAEVAEITRSPEAVVRQRTLAGLKKLLQLMTRSTTATTTGPSTLVRLGPEHSLH